MQPGVLLMMALLAWYLAAMLLFWYALREPHPTKRQAMEIPFALKEGQTILGIEDRPTVCPSHDSASMLSYQ
jgi:hypothetical protein